MGLLGDDREWETTLQEASLTATPEEIRMLFATVLTHRHVSNPSALWSRTWNLMSEDIQHAASISLCIPDLHMHPTKLENYTLYEVEGGIAVQEKRSYGRRYALHSEGKLVLVVAYSGIASLILPSEHESHTRKLIRSGEGRSISVCRILNVGDRILGTPDEFDPENTSRIEIPNKYRILDDETGLTNLIKFIFDDYTLLHPTARDLQEKSNCLLEK
nr:DNA helicase [Tanacetum cinerariifolium]